MLPRLLAPLCLGLLFSCTPAAAPEQEEQQPDVELKAARLTVTGLPSEQVLEGMAFNLSVSSKSDATIEYQCSVAENLVGIKVYGKNYRLTLGQVDKDTPVEMTFSQKATKEYEAASVSVQFTIKDNVAPTPPPAPEADPSLSGLRTVYQESMANIFNPERGLYGGGGDIRSASSPVTADKARSVRTSGKSLMYVGFYLTKYMDGDIAQDYLDMVQKSLDAMREGGVKCVLRFAYQNSQSATPWDPPVDIVLRHVEQLKPILQKNEDVIFVLQAGFIGVWGEWYYTANFNSMSDRRKLTDALLDALPASRQVALRTPEFPMMMYKLTVADTLTSVTAHDGSVHSRLCAHNDCFGATANDSGTFDNNNQREFWKGDSRYMIMGGETCKVSDYCLCDHSLQDIEDYHWTYLNSGYNTDVLNRWKTSGCYDEIVRRLGYRLVLLDTYRTETPKAGERFDLALRIQNRGVSAPQNPRNALLVFVDAAGNKTEFPLGEDPRTWHSGLHVIQTHFTLPSQKGTLYLLLSDPLLPERPEYSIALANEDIFDATTGYNKLFELR